MEKINPENLDWDVLRSLIKKGGCVFFHFFLIDPSFQVFLGVSVDPRWRFFNFPKFPNFGERCVSDLTCAQT